MLKFTDILETIGIAFIVSFVVTMLVCVALIGADVRWEVVNVKTTTLIKLFWGLLVSLTFVLSVLGMHRHPK